MKNLSRLFCLVLFFCTACKKQDNIKPVDLDKTYSIKFTVANNSTLNNATGVKVNNLKSYALADYAKVLYYNVYNNAGEQISQRRQEVSEVGFGVINDNLPTGTYTVVISAGDTDLGQGQASLYSGYYPFNSIFYIPKQLNTPSIWGDTFYKKIEINITNANIDQPVVLERVVSQFEIIATDAIPANASKITIQYNDEAAYYDLLEDKAFIDEDKNASRYLTVLIPDSVKGTSNFTIKRIVGNTIKPLTIRVTSYGANNAIIKEAIIQNVVCEKNKRTVISGKLFGASTSGFQLGVDAAWAPDQTVNF